MTKVSTIIGQIATASDEQTRGIEQVTKAVAQMDQVTQQNAASSEESASAAEELAAQAQELTELVKRFRLDSQASRSVLRAPVVTKKPSIMHTGSGRISKYPPV